MKEDGGRRKEEGGRRKEEGGRRKEEGGGEIEESEERDGRGTRKEAMNEIMNEQSIIPVCRTLGVVCLCVWGNSRKEGREHAALLCGGFKLTEAWESEAWRTCICRNHNGQQREKVKQHECCTPTSKQTQAGTLPLSLSPLAPSLYTPPELPGSP